MLARLPPELLCHVYSFLPPATVNQISLTCHGLYTSALPSLYSTVVLSFRKHIRQLESGLQHKEGFLQLVMRHHTKEILLKCKQVGQHRLTFDIRSLLRQLPHIRTLTLVDFHMIPINYITPLLSLLPHLEKLTLHYCDLVSASPNNNTTTNTLSLATTSLELFWTDFSKTAIETLLSSLPSLTNVRLLANHNRHYMANNHALLVLLHYCRKVKNLDIGLQEVDEGTVASSIMTYGEQIQRLSVRCHSSLILDSITKYAPFVQHLIIRFSFDILWHSSLATTQGTPTDNDETQVKNNSGLLHLLSHCQHLDYIQIITMNSTLTSDTLPPIVGKALASVAQKRLFISYPSTLIFSTGNNNNGSSTSDRVYNQRYSNGISPKKPPTSMDNDSEMINIATFANRLNKKASTSQYNLHEQRKWDEDMIQGDSGLQGSIYSNNVENDTMMVERTSQRRQNTSLPIQPPAINIATQVHALDSVKEHSRMESSLTLDKEQLNEIRWLATMM